VKVTIVIPGLGTGGAERSLAEMLPLLRESGIDCSVLCLHHRDEGVEQEVSAAGFPVKFAPAGNWVRTIRWLRHEIRRSGADVVHTTLFEADVLGRVATVGLPARVLTSLVNTSYDEVRLADPAVDRYRLWIVRQIDGFTARHMTDHFHAITETVKSAAIRDLQIKPELVTVVPRGRSRERLGLPTTARRERIRAQLGVCPDDPVLLSVGRQEYQKGYLTLLPALTTVLEAVPQAVALVAGRRGNATSEIESFLDHSNIDAQRLRFLGHRTDVADLMVAADLLVFPSLYEGLGGAILEAMALNLPVVASSLPAIEEFLTDGVTAWLVTPGDAGELSRAIVEALSDSEVRELRASRARVTFEERFRLERAAAETAKLYLTLSPSVPSS
jgi:glycosyltransferase involved in cell wall biosynthesis